MLHKDIEKSYDGHDQSLPLTPHVAAAYNISSDDIYH